ncbi:flagellar protein FlaG [Aeromonas hydrophila]|uniref:flagellar protein FlaG n=1 Tax=Aeromonas TaxID=642 RepID=UPI0022E85CBA|nr:MULTISPECIES: flagellar protein FlaG [Aeromonas]MBX9566998.1 flagellar protein FlaG [Aeromonas hydrophila]MDX7758238.1 flagellar protein FlaG [Aeromonas hydrophila]
MTNELGSLSSASGSSVLSKDKSGHSAALPLSGRPAESFKGQSEEKLDVQEESKPTSQAVKLSDDEVEIQVQKLQEFGRSQGWTVNFSLERELNKVVIKVVDSDSKSVIRQIPSEELLELSKRIRALSDEHPVSSPKVGLLLDREV